MKASTYFGLLLLLAACSNPAEGPPVDLATTASSSAERRVSSTSDDVEETSSGSMVRGSSAQVLNFSTDSLEIGLRFSDLNIPQGAKIVKAQLEFRAAAHDAGSTTLSVRAHDTDSAPGFKDEISNVSSRRATSASVRWSPSAWRWNDTYRSDDLSSVVQEVIDREGWRDGNALALMISGDLYVYGRRFSIYTTSLILAYRETGERDLIRQLDRLMNIAKGKLKDTNGDGYKNWLYLTDTDSSSRPFLNTDKHVVGIGDKSFGE